MDAFIVYLSAKAFFVGLQLPFIVIIALILAVLSYREGKSIWMPAGYLLAYALVLGIILSVPFSYNKLVKWSLGPSSAPVIALKKYLGFYPVKVTVSVIVEGKPIYIERIFECYKQIRMDESVLAEISLRSSSYHLLHQLESGNWFLTNLLAICQSDKNKKSIRETVGRMVPVWTNNLDTPKRVESYHRFNGAISDYRAKSPKIIMESLKASSVRLSWSQNPKLSKNQKYPTWYPFSRSSAINPGISEVELVYQVSGAQIIPFSEIKKLQWLSERISGMTTSGPLSLNDQEKAEFARAFAAHKQTQFPVGFVRPPTDEKLLYKSYRIPLRHTKSNIWELDVAAAGIGVFYLTGERQDQNFFVESEHQKIVPFKKWRTSERILIDGQLINPKANNHIVDRSKQIVIWAFGSNATTRRK